MKKLFIFLLAAMTTPLFAGTQIISDFDDTIKRSNIVNGGARTVGRSVLFYKAYSGMPELFQEMRRNANGLYVLSASPGVIEGIIKATLNSYKIPYNDVFTRDLDEIGTDEKKILYKLETIEKVIQSNPNDTLVLLGDNIEADHKVYLEAAARNPGKISDIYIRKVYNEDLPVGINGFFSAFEVAAKEYAHGRLSLAQVKRVGKEILATKSHRMYRVIPYYAYCPWFKDEFNLTTRPELMELEQKVISKIILHCTTVFEQSDED